MRSIVSFTARSLPGIGVAEKITVSPSCSSTLRVVAVGHPAQRRQRLALAAGRDHHQLVVREVLDLASGPRASPRGCRCGPSIAADVHVLAHRAADQRDLAPERRGGVHHLLHAVDVRGEAGDDDPPVAAREHLARAAAPRSTRTATCPAGRRWWSRRTGAAAPRAPARPAAPRRPGRRPPASGRTCSRR